MAREKINLVPNELKEKITIKKKILEGEITPEIFNTLPEKEKEKIVDILFEIASSKVDPNQGASTLEFVVFAFMRLVNKQLAGMSLTAEDQEIKEKLDTILNMHEITNTKISKKDWLFDYMEYAASKAEEILNNRKEHIERKKKTTGRV